MVTWHAPHRSDSEGRPQALAPQPVHVNLTLLAVRGFFTPPLPVASPHTQGRRYSRGIASKARANGPPSMM